MLRITMSVNSEGATKYFDAALSTGDYYAKEPGIWGGKGAAMLGLTGNVNRKDFVSLVSNKRPGTNDRLTIRTKDQRTAGYDFCFSVPKSVSLYLAETDDNAVKLMINEAFRETMDDVESRMECRVRRQDEDHNRTSGNMVYAAFIHTVTRPIDGVPDPHTHIHGFTINATFDAIEDRWKAGQFMNLKADAPFYEAAFNARLANKLIADGYAIRRTDRDFELASVSRELIEKFSKRTRAIEQLVKKKYVIIEAKARELMRKTNMAFADAFSQVKADLGAQTREKKSASRLSESEQLANWRSQMTVQDRIALKMDSVKGLASTDLVEPDIAKELSVSHLFERKSIARELHAAAWFLRRGIGNVGVAESREFIKTDQRFMRPDPNGPLVTTKEVREEENLMIDIVKEGRGKYPAFAAGAIPINHELTAWSAEQRDALSKVFRSTDLVTSIHGPAGSGKTSMMQSAVAGIRECTLKAVLVLAPSSSAVEVLKKEGFRGADTFATFKANPILQDVASGQVIWMDEAGFLSVKEMNWLVSFAVKNHTRLILSGDTAQHHSVERGDALRILETSGAVERIELTTIRRQKIEELRAAIQDLSQGRTEAGFDKLDEYGAIVEVEDKEERLSAIAELYSIALKEGKTSLIVAPTHGECRSIADLVRHKQQQEGKLGIDYGVWRLEKLNLSESQKQDRMNYIPGQVVEFHKKTKGGFKAGQQWVVLEVSELGVELTRGNVRNFSVPRDKAKNFDVYKSAHINLASGDVVRFTKNLKDGKERFKNNEFAIIERIGSHGIKFKDGRFMNMESAMHLDQGIAVTSHASQGKTVDQVIVSAPVVSFAQVNQAQFYVSMSRARESMHIFTDSKVALREAVQRPSDRLSPADIAGAHDYISPTGFKFEHVKEKQPNKERTR